MRLVVDNTNVLIRALCTDGPARQFLRLAPLTHTIAYHPEQIRELRDVAARPRLRIAPEAVDELAERLAHYGQPVETPLDEPGDCRDPHDNYILAIAQVASADVILTEDQDLLVLNPWRGMGVLRLHEFLLAHPLA